MEQLQSRSHGALYSSLFIIATAVISFILFLNYKHQTAFRDDYNQGRQLYAQGSPLAVSQFEEALKKAKSKEEEAIAKLNLGTAYLLSDAVLGIETLKQISSEESFPAEVRSASIIYIIQFRSFNFLGDKESEGTKFAEEHIFTGEKWGTFLNVHSRPLTLTNILDAEEKALEWASSIHSTSLIEFALANASGRRFLDLPLKERTQSDLADRAQQRYLSGESILQETLMTSAPSQIALTYMRQGTALEYLLKMGKMITSKATERAFRNSLRIIEENPTISYIQINRLFVQFRLASTIARSGDISRFDEVRLLLTDILKVPVEVRKTHGLFILFKQLQKEDVRKLGYSQDLRKLASIDLRLHDLLVEEGWKEGDFR